MQNNVSSESDASSLNSQIPESFPPNLENDNGGSTSKRPMGVQRARMKKKMKVEQLPSGEENLSKTRKLYYLLKSIREKQVEKLEEKMDLEREKLALFREAMEDKLLMQDLRGIANPMIRALLEDKQMRIVEKRNRVEAARPRYGLDSPQH